VGQNAPSGKYASREVGGFQHLLALSDHGPWQQSSKWNCIK